MITTGALVESRVCGLRDKPAVGEHQTARRYFVSGVVQGVGYRHFARGAAQRTGVTGYVRNLSDGRVEVYAIGQPGNLNELRTRLECGPRGASVSDVQQEDAAVDVTFAADFSIEYED